MPDKIIVQPPDDDPSGDDRQSSNRARLIKLIRVAVKQAQSEGEYGAVNDLLAILKTLNVSAPALVVSMAAVKLGLG